MYMQGAMENARLAQRFYPDWTCRFYLGSSVPADVVADLRAQPNVETLQVEEPEDLRAMFWRFRAAGDADVLLCRDADSRFSRAEAAAVQAWLESGKEAHAMVHNRPHSPYSMDLRGGLFGVRGQALQDLHREASRHNPKDAYGDDEHFLRQHLKPLLLRRDALLVHDLSWGWGEPPPLPPEDAFGAIWFHEPQAYLHPFPRYRGGNYFTGLLAPPVTGRLRRALGRRLRRLHKGLGGRLVLLGVITGRPAGWEWRWRRFVRRPQMVNRREPEDIPGTRQSMANIPSPERGLIAFALPSKDPELLRGALDNARAARAYYPEWQCRFHAHPSLDPQVRQELESVPGVQVRVADANMLQLDPHLWGLHLADECDALLLRSPLARLNLYDRQTVYHWLASDCEMHSLHDHPRHGWHRPTTDLVGLRGSALAWAKAHPDHPDPLGALARQAKEGRIGWLRHDNVWHIGTPLPRPRLESLIAYHGMPWEPSEEYGGLILPVLEDYRDREMHWEGVRFLVTALASRALRLRRGKSVGAERLMTLLCRLLYPGRQPGRGGAPN